MIRVGIVGAESSHASAFAKYFNVDRPYEDIRVTAVYGDKEACDAIVKDAGVEVVCSTVEEMAQMVDAVMITTRHGSRHYEETMPFVEKGMPVFVDKPFTADPAQAKELYRQMQLHGCKVTGGSGCKLASGIAKARELVDKLRQEGIFVSAAQNYIMIMESEYDGIFFYGPHLVEMALATFGYDAKAVTAVRTGTSMLVTMQYENDAVSLHFNRDGLRYGTMIYTTKEFYCLDTEIEIFQIKEMYAQEADVFADLLHGKTESLSEEEMVRPIEVLAAIERSLQTGQRAEI